MNRRGGTSQLVWQIGVEAAVKVLEVNGPAYGSDVTFNAIRLSGSLAKRDGVHLQAFLSCSMGTGSTVSSRGCGPGHWGRLDGLPSERRRLAAE